VVGAHDGRPVYLGDVAQVRDGPLQPARYVWTGTGPGAARAGLAAGIEHPAVTLQVTKKPGENAVDVAARVVARAAELHGTVIPDDVRVTVTRNYGATANDKAQQLIKKLIFATLSVIVLVFATLGWREALIVGVAVLLTLATTLFASWAWGFTLTACRCSRSSSPSASSWTTPSWWWRTSTAGARSRRRAHRHHPGRRGRGGRPDHPRHLHRDRSTAADGLRQRPHGPT